MRIWIGLLGLFLMVAFGIACGGPPKAEIGAACTKDTDCNDKKKLTCLTAFVGGYCGIEGCTSDSSCPTGSTCVSHTNGKKYCFQICKEKGECSSSQSTCTKNVIFVDGPKGNKVCLPTTKN